jgi:hypothetical protein
MINRYKGYCKSCDGFVPAGEGIYDFGATWCGELIRWPNASLGYICAREWNSMHDGPTKTAECIIAEMEAKAMEVENTRRENLLKSLIEGGELEALGKKANVRSLQAVITKIAGDKTLAELDLYEALHVQTELRKRIGQKNRKKELVEYKSNGICWRCGGAGKADKWMHTGYVCYQCGGTGKA